jgi:hypothetical protein
MCEIAMFLLGAFFVGYFRKDSIVVDDDVRDRDEADVRPEPAVRRRTTAKRRRA